jgi:hypothetical protein
VRLIERPAASDTSRRVLLVTPTPVAFKSASHPTITTMEIEPVSGIGDEAFYQLYPSDGPFIWVRKGNVAISIRILTGSRGSELPGRWSGLSPARTARSDGASRLGGGSHVFHGNATIGVGKSENWCLTRISATPIASVDPWRLRDCRRLPFAGSSLGIYAVGAMRFSGTSTIATQKSPTAHNVLSGSELKRVAPPGIEPGLS